LVPTGPHVALVIGCVATAAKRKQIRNCRCCRRSSANRPLSAASTASFRTAAPFSFIS